MENRDLSDVLILGGGVIGLSIARELHKRGVSRITVIDKGTIGQEASWAAAGILAPQLKQIRRTSSLTCAANRVISIPCLPPSCSKRPASILSLKGRERLTSRLQMKMR